MHGRPSLHLLPGRGVSPVAACPLSSLAKLSTCFYSPVLRSPCRSPLPCSCFPSYILGPLTFPVSTLTRLSLNPLSPS